MTPMQLIWLPLEIAAQDLMLWYMIRLMLNGSILNHLSSASQYETLVFYYSIS